MQKNAKIYKVYFLMFSFNISIKECGYKNYDVFFYAYCNWLSFALFYV